MNGPSGGDHQEGRKWQIQPSLMYLCLNTKRIADCSNRCSSPCMSLSPPTPPSLSSTHNSNEKTWPWSRQCKSNREEIDGWNDSGLVRRDSCSRQLRAIGLEIDASEDTAPKLRRYSANTSRVQGSDYYQLIYIEARHGESWLMNGMILNSSV